MTKLLASVLLIAINIWLVWQPTAQQFPFVPPLTHTPGMGLSLIGTPDPPPFLYIPQLETLGGTQCSQCSKIESTLHQHLQRGKDLRLQMYDQTTVLLSLLPPQTMSAALQHRDDNERRIGEVFLWKELSTR